MLLHRLLGVNRLLLCGVHLHRLCVRDTRLLIDHWLLYVLHLRSRLLHHYRSA